MKEQNAFLILIGKWINISRNQTRHAADSKAFEDTGISGHVQPSANEEERGTYPTGQLRAVLNRGGHW